MYINFENYGKFFITLYYDDKTHDNYDGQGAGYTLKEAMDFVSENIENSSSIISVDIGDMETGEIVMVINHDDSDVDVDMIYNLSAEYFL